MQDIRDLDGISFTQWFTSHGGSMNSIKRMWDPIGRWGERQRGTHRRRRHKWHARHWV